MGPYVWCVLGVVMGWVAGSIGAGGSFTDRIESVAVAVFGAFLGGEFAPAMFMHGDAVSHGLSGITVGLAIAGALLSLLLLAWMRKAVGPLKSGKKKKNAAS